MSVIVLLIASPVAAQDARPSPQAEPPAVPSLGSAGTKWDETADHVLIHTEETKWNRALKSALPLPDWIDLGLEQRTRFEVYDHPWRATQTAGRTDPQIQQRSRIRVGLEGGPFRFLFEGQDSRTHLDDAGDFVDDRIENRTDILQVFVSATVMDVPGTGLRGDLHLGRLTMNAGARRLIARNDFRNTTNAFDGVHAQLAHGGAWRVRTFLVEPVLRDDVRLDEQSAETLFWGVYGERSHGDRLHLDAYYLGLNDVRRQEADEHRTLSMFGVRVVADPARKQVDYDLESTWQTGTKGGTDHVAHYQHFELGYTFDLPWSPRVLAQYDYASGTRTPGGGRHATFDALFGARRFDLMPTGNFGPFPRSNLSSPGWRVIVRPDEGWEMQVKHRVWYLAQGRDEFVGSGLQDATGSSGNFLGHDVELRVQWKLTDNLAVDAGYDHWFKGSYFERLPPTAGLPPGGERDTDYFYVLAEVRL